MKMDYGSVMARAYHLASESPDPSTQTSAIILAGGGEYGAYNRINLKWRQEYEDREFKYKWVTHAESGAVYAASREGAATFQSTMVAPWAACARCGIAIAEAGIKTLVLHKQRMEIPSNWDKEIKETLFALRAAGVDILFLDSRFPDCPEIKIGNGKMWQP